MPVRFCQLLGQCFSTMQLYGPGHPARERVVDGAFDQLLQLVRDRPVLQLSFIDEEVVFEGRLVPELRGWEWGRRLAAVGVARIEADADVTREAFDAFLDEVARRLGGMPSDTAEARQLVRSAIRFGPIAIKGTEEGGGGGAGGGGWGGGGAGAGPAGGGAGLAPGGPGRGTGGPGAGLGGNGPGGGVAAGGGQDLVGAALDALAAVDLSVEAATIGWVHEEIQRGAELPVVEVETVVRSLALALRGERRTLLPLLQLRRYDQYTTTHALNVSVLAMGLAERLGLRRDEVRSVGVSGLLHDLGKVKIPREILVKPGRFTDEERAVVQRHPVDGARLLLEGQRGFGLAAVVAYEHHVALNGGGYPAFRYARDCHLASRIVHVCDVFDALCTNRPYRDPWEPEQALAYLATRVGEELDPSIVTAFAGLVRESYLTRVPLED